MAITLTNDEYRDHCNDFDGFCENCDEITRDGGTEPDAENYHCPVCDGRTCFGIEKALLMGFIDISD